MFFDILRIAVTATIYLGAKVEVLISTPNTIDKNELHNFRLKTFEFYIELASEIKKRFDFSDDVLNYLKILYPEMAISGEIGSIAVLSQKHFPQLVTDIEMLNSEWRLLADLGELKKKSSRLYRY